MRVIYSALLFLTVISATAQSSSGVFINVKDSPYSARGDGSTDDTTAIQLAIDAISSTGGVIYFPVGIYIVGGALQDTSYANSQLTLPLRSVLTDQPISISFVGAVPQTYQTGNLTSIPAATNGSVIKSTLSSGAGSLIAAKTGGAQNSSLAVQFANLTFRMPANPSNSCLNMGHVPVLTVRNVIIDCGALGAPAVTQPTTTTSYGLITPVNNSPEVCILDHVAVVGFYNGIQWNELVDGDAVCLEACKVGLSIPFGYHASLGKRVLFLHCTTLLKFVGGDHYIDIRQLDVERDYTGQWYSEVYAVDDASNYGHGNITWHGVESGVGVDTRWAVNGAANLSMTKLGSFVGASSTNTWTATGTNWTQIVRNGVVTSTTHSP